MSRAQDCLASCLYVICFILIFAPERYASSIKIRPDTCTNALGEHGTCMFVWECIKKDGKQLGPCVDRFLVGTCCSLPNIEVEHNSVLRDVGTVFNSSAILQDTNIRPAASNVHVNVFPPTSVVTSSAVMGQKKNGSFASVSGAAKPLGKNATTSSQANKKTIDYSECGIPHPRPKMKVVGGHNANFGDWPWQVSVRRSSFFGFASTHRCGGAILNTRWVITAAHCVDDLLQTQIRIRAGEFDFSSTQEPYPYQERGLERKIVHPKYNFFTYEYDLALVKLDSPLKFQPHIKPVCLPPLNDTLEGRNATVTGWGRLSEGGALPSILQEVKVPIVSNERCREMFLNAGRQENIPDIFMCAGYDRGGKDSCQGDSGGPLQVKGRDGKWFLAGVISWGIGCAEANMPGVCTRVSKFIDWINQTVS